MNSHRIQQRPSTALAVWLAATGLLALPNSVWAQSPIGGGNPLNNLPVTPSTLRNSVNSLGGTGTSGRVLPVPLPSQPASTTALTPQRFDIEGVEVITFYEVAALFKPLVGNATTVAKLTDLARQCTALYKQRGYALSFCYIPEQDFKAGVVRVVAVEGYIQTVKIDGDAGKDNAKIRELAEHIRAEHPLTLATFDRYTQLMGQLPGLRVTANATPPAATDGAGSLTLKVTRQPYQLSLGTDFRSSGPRAVLTGALNDPLAAGSSLSASTLVGARADEHFWSSAYSQNLNSEGLTLKAEVSLYKGNPDADLAVQPQLHRYNTYRRADLSASYPLKLTRNESLILSGGAYAVNNQDDYNNPSTGGQLSDEVKVRAIYAQASYSQSKDDQARALSLRFIQGLKGFGADALITTNVSSIAPVNPAQLDFSRIVVDGSQRNTWGQQFGTAISFATQYSPSLLPTTERISFGSTRFGRAYEAGEIAGDSGWGLGLEVNRSFAVGSTWLKQLQPYVLLESARVYSSNGTAGSSAFNQLGSASLGLRFSDGVHYNLDLATSKPVGQASASNPSRDMRLSMLLTYSFAKN